MGHGPEPFTVCRSTRWVCRKSTLVEPLNGLSPSPAMVHPSSRILSEDVGISAVARCAQRIPLDPWSAPCVPCACTAATRRYQSASLRSHTQAPNVPS